MASNTKPLNKYHCYSLKVVDIFQNFTILLLSGLFYFSAGKTICQGLFCRHMWRKLSPNKSQSFQKLSTIRCKFNISISVSMQLIWFWAYFLRKNYNNCLLIPFKLLHMFILGLVYVWHHEIKSLFLIYLFCRSKPCLAVVPWKSPDDGFSLSTDSKEVCQVIRDLMHTSPFSAAIHFVVN